MNSDLNLFLPNLNIKENPTDHNLYLLWNREKGKCFYVEKGRFKIITSWQEKIKYFFFKYWIQQEVKEQISLLTEHFVKQNLGDNFYTILFFEKLGHLSHSVFDRKFFKTAIIPNYTYVENALLRAVEEEEEENLKEKSAYTNAITAVKAANKVGIDFELMKGGSSGVYRGFDLHGHASVIFKPLEEGPYEPFNPKWRTWLIRKIQACFAIRRASLQHQASKSEEWASAFYEKFLNEKNDRRRLVPTTRGATFISKAFYKALKKAGSCQLWVPDSKEAAVYVPSRFGLYYPQNKEVPINLDSFQKLAIFDFATGNQDRDTDNWFVVDLNGGEKFSSVIAFDNGLAFPHSHPKGFLSTRKQYMWGKLKNAEYKFTGNSVELIKNFQGITKENLKALFKDFTDEQTEAMLERLLVLSYSVYMNKTVKELVEIKTPLDFKELFNKEKSGIIAFLNLNPGFQSLLTPEIKEKYKIE